MIIMMHLLAQLLDEWAACVCALRQHIAVITTHTHTHIQQENSRKLNYTIHHNNYTVYVYYDTMMYHNMNRRYTVTTFVTLVS
jgi:hypothetical protein